jgi:DNA-cytosine methyltransferase
MTKRTYLEFFAGGGMARAGLGESWRCLFANDFDRMKVETYEANWGAGDIKHTDVASLTLSDLPRHAVDLAWASFPCQDLSLAGSYRGLGRERDKVTTRSGTFWPFWKLIRGLAQDGRAPRAIVLENVYGCLTSHEGRDFAAIASALTELGYQFGAAVIDAVHFVPQSRPRVFFIAFRGDQPIPTSLIPEGPQVSWHPAALIEAHAGMPATAKRNWIWWRISPPLARNSTFADLIEDAPTAAKWHGAAHTDYILSLMSPLNRKKVADASQAAAKWLAPCIGAPAPTKTGSSASAPRFVSTVWPAAFAPRRAARRVRSSWWLKARQSGRAYCRRAKRRGSWDWTTIMGFRRAITTPTMSVATAYARQSCGISPDMFLNLSSLITRGRRSSRRRRKWRSTCSFVAVPFVR